jgi:hypothetical protein
MTRVSTQRGTACVWEVAHETRGVRVGVDV